MIIAQRMKGKNGEYTVLRLLNYMWSNTILFECRHVIKDADYKPKVTSKT